MNARSDLAALLQTTRDVLKDLPEHEALISLAAFTEKALRGELETCLIVTIDRKDEELCACISGEPGNSDAVIQGAVDFVAGLLLSIGADPEDVKSVLCASVDRCSQAISPAPAAPRKPPTLRLVAGTDVPEADTKSDT